MDAFNFVNQENQEQQALPGDEEIIKLLGLTSNNAGRVVEQLVQDLDLGNFTETSTVVPAAAAPAGHAYIQGQFVSGVSYQIPAYQPIETISIVDLDSTQAENTQYHLTGGYMVNYETSALPSPVQEVSSPAPPSPVATQDTRQVAGGKAQGRKPREKKVKLYERTEPFASPEKERQRLNAINAKVNRDKKKNERQELENQVKTLTTERDGLKIENTKLKTKLQIFESQLKAVCKQYNVPMVILPQ